MIEIMRFLGFIYVFFCTFVLTGAMFLSFLVYFGVIDGGAKKQLPATESVMLINSSQETRANDNSKYLNWAVSETDKEIVINFQCSVKGPKR